jgi:hypothetical protein
MTDPLLIPKIVTDQSNLPESADPSVVPQEKNFPAFASSRVVPSCLRRSCLSAAFTLVPCLLLIVAFCLTLDRTAASEESDGVPALLIAPAFLRPPIYRYLPDAKRTILYPALLKHSGESEPLDGKHFETPEDWNRFIGDSRERSRLQLATLDPTLVRDSHGVIQMAVIFTDSPVTATCILAPGFLEHFSAIFGPELLIAIPTQNKIYVFPKLANKLQAMTDTIRDDYLISPMPASTELFELSRHGLHAVGSLNPDDD